MFRKVSLAVIVLAFLLPACDAEKSAPPPPPPESDAALAPTGSLSAGQVFGVLECQRTIKHEARDFGAFKEWELDRCLDATLGAQLGFENGLTNTSAYDSQLIGIRQDCTRRFQEVGAASTRLVNRIVAACTPVQSIIIPASGYDPLEFGALANELNISGGTAVTLAGEICGAKELLVDSAETIQVPRMVQLLNILDAGTGQFAVTGPQVPFLDLPTTLPNIPLDTRCTFPQLPPSLL
jgi:hypothetical protein